MCDIKSIPSIYIDDFIPCAEMLSDETHTCSVEQLLKLPESYVHEGVLYKRHVLRNINICCFTKYKPLCLVSVPKMEIQN